jgi:hypothetical protein
VENILMGNSKIDVKKVRAQTVCIIGNYPNDSIEMLGKNLNRLYLCKEKRNPPKLARLKV